MKLKMSDITKLATGCNVTAGLLAAFPDRGCMTDARTGMPIDPNEIEAVEIYGMPNNLREFDRAMREQHGFQFTRTNRYLTFPAERVDFS